MDQQLDLNAQALTPAPEPPPLPPLPTPTVQEVHESEPEPVVYRYVVKPAVEAYHIWEEVTGQRVTTHPLPSRAEALESARIYNNQQAPPR